MTNIMNKSPLSNLRNTTLTNQPLINQSMEIMEITQPQLMQLYRHDVIDERGYHYAQSHHLPPLQWRQWILRLCIGLGTALLLLGIVFFFAYNWHAMPKWSKLALIEGAMVLSFGGAILFGTRKLLGQCLLLAGTVFIGVFFAVFGQIYQTGADAWQLFALWAVLMFGFLWLSQFPAQWILQWSITGLALFLLMQQAMTWGRREYEIQGLIMAVYTLAVWGLQMGLAKRQDWLNCRWLRVLTLLIAHVWLLWSGALSVFNENGLFMLIMAVTTWLLWWHIQRKIDLLSQVIGTTTLAMLLWVLVAYMVVRGSDIISGAVFMLLVTVGLSVGIYQAVVALKKHHLIKES